MKQMIAIEKENNTNLKEFFLKTMVPLIWIKEFWALVVDLFTNNVKMDDTEESTDLLEELMNIVLHNLRLGEGQREASFIRRHIVKTLVSIFLNL